MSKPPSRLGRGLGSLIPSAGEAAARPTVIEVPVDQIVPNPYQPRQALDPEGVEELAASIRAHGLIQPLIVTSQGARYQLIAGERRWTAARLAGMATVPVIVKEATAQAMLELALVENVQRADLNVLEEAAAYQQLHEEFGLTHEQIAERVGKSRVAVTNTLRLLRLSEPVRAAILDGRVSANHGRALLMLPPEAQPQALDLIIEMDLNARQTEALVRKLLEAEDNPPRAERPVGESRAESPQILDRFREALRTKVDLVRGKKGGRLVIYFYSDEELQGLYDLLVRE
ncbi:MAG: ParB/RepB/Spo0J family partition protein [Anaerolineae bacterium]